MTPEEHLLAAANDLAEHGMCKESFYDPQCGTEWRTASACALGALSRVADLTQERGLIDTDVHSTPAARRLAKTIRAKFGNGLAGMDNYAIITSYNDSDQTSAEDMILAMKEAAHNG